MNAPLARFIALRQAFDDHLPINNSLIALDLLMLVLKCHLEGNRPQVKVLLESLHHSRAGVDYHLRLLIASGWIELLPCQRDKRVRYAQPSAQLLEQFQAALTAVQEVGDRSSEGESLR